MDSNGQILKKRLRLQYEQEEERKKIQERSHKKEYDPLDDMDTQPSPDEFDLHIDNTPPSHKQETTIHVSLIPIQSRTYNQIRVEQICKEMLECHSKIKDSVRNVLDFSKKITNCHETIDSLLSKLDALSEEFDRIKSPEQISCYSPAISSEEEESTFEFTRPSKRLQLIEPTKAEETKMEALIHKKRGRPLGSTNKKKKNTSKLSGLIDGEKRKRGRPRKYQIEDDSAVNTTFITGTKNQ